MFRHCIVVGVAAVIKSLCKRQQLTSRFLGKLTLACAVLVLQACSGGSGGGASNQDAAAVLGNSDGAGFTYSGPDPANIEIQSFKREFYDNLVIAGRCGDCHTTGGPGPTLFVDKDDVNNAWQAANSVVNLDDPASSTVVIRVSNGHNCWLGSDQTASCRTTMIAYITAWAAGAFGEVTTVQLLPRTPVAAAPTKLFPEAYPPEYVTPADTSLYGLLTTYCQECHNAAADVPQSPYFAGINADSSIDTDATQAAYEAAQSKVDLITPENSRFFIRLAEEGHNCWTSNCDNDAEALRVAIQAIADSITIEPIDPDLVISLAQVLADDGILASSGGRYEDDIVAKWTFSEGINPADIAGCLDDPQCTLTSADTSGVQPEITLTLAGDFEFKSSGGVEFFDGTARGLASTSEKLRDTLQAASEYSIEAWVIPGNVTQEETSIISYSGISDNRNFLLGQTLYNYDFFNRSSATGDNGGGEPGLSTDDDDELLQATLQHVVMTFDPVNGRRIYVNGEFAGVVDEQGGGNLANWNDSFSVVLGNDSSGSRPWSGIIRLAALHSRALTEEQITQNFEVGVGVKYFLLFSVSELIDREGVCHEGAGSNRVNYCYVVFTVSQFDDYAYLFSDPFFVTLNEDNFNLADTVIKGISVGVNGKLAATGQAFLSVNTSISSDNYTTGGVPLVDIGTVVALERGALDDQFFLAFEQFGDQTGIELTPVPGPTAFSYSLPGDAASDIGVRTFEEINESLAEVTGIPSTTTSVLELFNGVAADASDEGIRRQMPSIADFQGFQASHQTAIAQLAIAYCDALVANTTARAAFFEDGTSFNFGTRADLVSDGDWTTKVIHPLLEAALVLDGTGPDPLVLTNSQPARADIEATLLNLITDPADLKPYPFDTLAADYVSTPDGNQDGLARCNGACAAGRTEEVVKAVCAAVFGSAVIVLQ